MADLINLKAAAVDTRGFFSARRCQSRVFNISDGVLS